LLDESAELASRRLDANGDDELTTLSSRAPSFNGLASLLLEACSYRPGSPKTPEEALDAANRHSLSLR
jgi:hypothetical protein